MPAHTGMRARAAAGGGGGRPARAWAWVRVRVLAWFFLNQVPRASSGQQLRTCWTAKGCEPDPLPPTVAYLLDCQRLQTNWTANSHDCWVERLQAFVWVRTCWPLLEGYIKGSNSQLKDTPITTTTTPRANTSLLSLSSEHFNFSAF